jgi:hypothetical protein
MLSWKHCSKVIPQPSVCHFAVLSVVRKKSEAKVHASVEQHIIIKFLTKEGRKTLETKDFFLSGICKLPDRWRKCIANQGDYVER